MDLVVLDWIILGSKGLYGKEEKPSVQCIDTIISPQYTGLKDWIKVNI